MAKSTKNVRSEAARKANVTRRARKEFGSRYPETAWIAERILKDGECYAVELTVEAAVRANLNRSGTYQDMALACNFS